YLVFASFGAGTSCFVSRVALITYVVAVVPLDAAPSAETAKLAATTASAAAASVLFDKSDSFLMWVCKRSTGCSPMLRLQELHWSGLIPWSLVPDYFRPKVK